MQVLVIDLGDARLGGAPQVGEERTQHGPLLLERMHLAEKQVELDPTDPHRADAAQPAEATRATSIAPMPVNRIQARSSDSTSVIITWPHAPQRTTVPAPLG